MENTITKPLREITPDDVAWLHAGSEIRGRRIRNTRAIVYTTPRGTRKSITSFVYPDGSVYWRVWDRAGTKNTLTTEEARIFAPEIAAKHDARAAARKAKRAENAANGNPVKIGDVFVSSFGYEACFYDWYEVVSVSDSGMSVTVRQLAEERTGDHMDWQTRAKIGCYAGKPERHKLKWDAQGNPYFRVNSYTHAWIDRNPGEWVEEYNYH